MCWLYFNRKNFTSPRKSSTKVRPAKPITATSSRPSSFFSELYRKDGLGVSPLKRVVLVAVHSTSIGGTPLRNEGMSTQQRGRHACIKPIGSMGLLYLPTWMVDSYGKWRQIYQSHPSFLENESSDATIDFHSPTMVAERGKFQIFLCEKKRKTFLRWWFNRFFYVHPLRNDPIWRAYFSNGSKPPTT